MLTARPVRLMRTASTASASPTLAATTTRPSAPASDSARYSRTSSMPWQNTRSSGDGGADGGGWDLEKDPGRVPLAARDRTRVEELAMGRVQGLAAERCGTAGAGLRLRLAIVQLCTAAAAAHTRVLEGLCSRGFGKRTCMPQLQAMPKRWEDGS